MSKPRKDYPIWASNDQQFVRIVQPVQKLSGRKSDMILCERPDGYQWYIPEKELKEEKQKKPTAS